MPTTTPPAPVGRTASVPPRRPGSCTSAAPQRRQPRRSHWPCTSDGSLGRCRCLLGSGDLGVLRQGRGEGRGADGQCLDQSRESAAARLKTSPSIKRGCAVPLSTSNHSSIQWAINRPQLQALQEKYCKSRKTHKQAKTKTQTNKNKNTEESTSKFHLRKTKTKTKTKHGF